MYHVIVRGLLVWLLAIATDVAAAHEPLRATHVVDAIKVLIFNEDGSTIVITESDAKRPSLDGAVRSLEDIIFEHLVYEQAKRFKILPSQDDIDKHLKAVQRENNLTLEQLKKIFAAAGYTYEQGRQQFAMLSAVNSVLDFKIRSRLIVPERDVRAYYQANPETIPTRYLLERAVVEVPEGTDQQAFKQLLDTSIKKNKFPMDIVWSKSFWILKSDLAEDKQFITTMQPGTVTEPQPCEGGFEVLKLVSVELEHEVPLQDRYQEIATLLRKPRYEQLMAEFRKSLFDSACIIYL